MLITDQVATAPCTDPIQVQLMILRKVGYVWPIRLELNHHAARRQDWQHAIEFTKHTTS